MLPKMPNSKVLQRWNHFLSSIIHLLVGKGQLKIFPISSFGHYSKKNLAIWISQANINNNFHDFWIFQVFHIFFWIGNAVCIFSKHKTFIYSLSFKGVTQTAFERMFLRSSRGIFSKSFTNSSNETITVKYLKMKRKFICTNYWTSLFKM